MLTHFEWVNILKMGQNLQNGSTFKKFYASFLSFCASFTNDLPTSMRVDTGDSTGAINIG